MARTPTSELVATIEEVRRTRGILADLVRAMEQVVRRVDKLTLNLERLERRVGETLGPGE